jgi:hypothetical protein
MTGNRWRSSQFPVGGSRELKLPKNTRTNSQYIFEGCATRSHLRGKFQLSGSDRRRERMQVPESRYLKGWSSSSCHEYGQQLIGMPPCRKPRKAEPVVQFAVNDVWAAAQKSWTHSRTRAESGATNSDFNRILASRSGKKKRVPGRFRISHWLRGGRFRGCWRCGGARRLR